MLFLPGLLVVRKLLEAAGADEMRYVKVSVGQVYLSCLTRRQDPRSNGLSLRETRAPSYVTVNGRYRVVR